MAIQASRLNDDKYLHWLRTSLSLLYLKEGLCPFCDEKSKEFHADIIGKVQRKNNSAATSTCSTCTCRSIKKKNQHGVFTWKLHCGRNICNEWLDEILLSHKDYPCPDIAWANSNPQLWTTDDWELAKLFQPYGCASHKSAADSDCQGLLRLMKTCTYFHTFLSDRIVLEQINDVRNACMHSSDLRVEEVDMRQALTLMISLLEQPHLINRPSCVEAKTKICQLRDNILDISLNKELELQALNNRIEAVHGDVDSLEAELKTSLSDITARQDTTAEEYRKTCERVRELGQKITEMKTCQEQISQTVDTRLNNLEAQRQNKMADLTSRLQELETNSNTEIERLSKIEARLDNLEMQRIAQQTDQQVDIKDLQRQLIRMYEDQRKHIPVYLLRSDRKLQLDDIYVEQRLKVIDPDGRLKTDSAVSNRNKQARSGIKYKQPKYMFQTDESEQITCLLRDVFYIDDTKCQYVYVSGNAGYGKSVFCSHLVRSWCAAHSESKTELTPDEEFMTEFSLLFCIDLRDARFVDNDTPDEICYLIQKQLQLSELSLTDNGLIKLLQDNGQVLVLMDALDECKEVRLPKRGLHSHYTTLVTSRPWKLEALRCDPEYRIDKELEIVGLKTGSPEDLSEKLVNLLNNKWKKTKDNKNFIEHMKKRGLTEFLDVPILLTSMLCLWFDDIPFGQSQIEIHKNSIHHQILTAVKAKDLPQYSCPSGAPFPVCQKEKCPCKHYGELLWKVSELACKALLGNVRERSLVMDHDQTEILGLTDIEVDVCMKLGILTQYKLLGNVTDYEPQKSVCFTHKTYQEWFAAIFLSSNVPVTKLEKLLSDAIVDLDTALELDKIFLFVCGLNEEVAAKLSEIIMMKVSSDARVQKYRESNDVYTTDSPLIWKIQDIIVAGVIESEKNGTKNTALQLHDVYIDGHFGKFSCKQIFACDTSLARSVYMGYVRDNERTALPASSCLETLRLYNITNCSGDAFCDALSVANLACLQLQNVKLTHYQLEKLYGRIASAARLTTVNIDKITCKTHQDNIQECHIQLDFSQYVNINKLWHAGWEWRPIITITSCPSSTCMETVGLRHVDISSCDTFCDSFNVDNVSEMVLEDVTLTHDQLQSLCILMVSARNLMTINIDELNCITHADTRQKCDISLDLSQHAGLKYLSFEKINKSGWQRPNIKITSWPTSTYVDILDLRHVDMSRCDTFCKNLNVHNMSKMVMEDVILTHDQLEMVLGNVTLTHDELESLCVNLMTVRISKLTCTTHVGNEQECHILLDFSQYVNLENIWHSWWGQISKVKITSWPVLTWTEKLYLHDVDISLCDVFCDNFNLNHVSALTLQDVTLTQDQLDSLFESLASAVNLRTVNIDNLTCLMHKDNRQDCKTMLDLSRLQGLEKLTLCDSGVCEFGRISLCQNMIKLEKMMLENVTLTHDELESLCVNLASAVNLKIVYIDNLTCLTHKDNRQDCITMLDLSRLQGLENLTLWGPGVGEFGRISLCQNMIKLKMMMLKDVTLTHDELLEEIRQAAHTRVDMDDVEYKDDECVVKKFMFWINDYDDDDDDDDDDFDDDDDDEEEEEEEEEEEIEEEEEEEDEDDIKGEEEQEGQDQEEEYYDDDDDMTYVEDEDNDDSDDDDNDDDGDM